MIANWGRAPLTGILLLMALIVCAIMAPAIATHDPAVQFSDFVFAPPMRPRVMDHGRPRAPFINPLHLEDRLARRYSKDAEHPVTLRWFEDGRLVSAGSTPWFPLGTDALGRDVFARLVYGTRLSLGVAAVAIVVSLVLGAAAGALAGLWGGPVDEGLMRVADFVIALPAIYVALTLRAALPLVLTTGEVFWTMAAVLSAAGWPFAAKGVRAIVSAERSKAYAEAAMALGASRTRLLLRHLLPATRGFLGAQAVLLVPGFIVAEATLSFVGLGFQEAEPSWGVMLQEAARGPVLAEAAWLLAPAGAIACTVLAINLVTSGDLRSPPRLD